MDTRQQSEHTRRSLLGKIMVAIGSIALLADLSVLVRPIERLVQSVSEGLFALLPSVGLSVLHAASAIAFHQVDYFSLVTRILVLFTAMVAVIVGVTLLHSTAATALHGNPLRASAFNERETHNG